MKNSDIQYNTSKDYDKLYELLKMGNKLIGFIALDTDIEGVPDLEHSRIITLNYNFFDMGFCLFEPSPNKPFFVKTCKKNNIQYLDVEKPK